MKVQINTEEVYACSFPNCKRTPVYRHHKGCDNFIGRFNRSIMAQYYLYLDCVNVCDKHHMMIHYCYGRIIKAHVDFTPSGVLVLRTKLIEYCDRLLAGKAKLRKPSKEFVKEWRRRRRRWLRMRKQS